MSSEQKVTQKIWNYFKTKYPNTYDAIGLNETDINMLVAKIFTQNPTDNTDKKERINNLISLLERKVSERVYSENRQKNTVNTNKYTMDPQIDISFKTYADVPFDTKPALTTDTVKGNAAENDTNAYKKLFELDKESVLNASGIDKNNILRSEFKDLLSPEERPFIYNIVIDSKDRDFVKYTSASSFVIDFSPPMSQNGDGNINTGYISIAFGNIISCELLDIILLDTSKEHDSSDKLNPVLPYVIFEVAELGSNYYGTNDNLSRCFATLTSYHLQDGYKHYNINGENSNHTIMKVYNPRINLNRMTIKLKLPDGTPYLFGADADASTKTVFKMSFRITTLQKNLSTGFINKALY
jgi:hypothetical protein